MLMGGGGAKFVDFILASVRRSCTSWWCARAPIQMPARSGRVAVKMVDGWWLSAAEAAEHEKDLHVAALGALTDEEREAEMQLRRLDLRARGTGGGAYKAATYDQEVSQMEAQALAEMRVGEEHMVTAMNRDIYAMDAIAEQAEADRIEAEEADLGHLADDDDHGDRDGDEGY